MKAFESKKEAQEWVSHVIEKHNNQHTFSLSFDADSIIINGEYSSSDPRWRTKWIYIIPFKNLSKVTIAQDNPGSMCTKTMELSANLRFHSKWLRYFTKTALHHDPPKKSKESEVSIPLSSSILSDVDLDELISVFKLCTS